MKFHNIILILGIFLASCGQGEKKSTETTNESVQEQPFELIPIKSDGFSLMMAIPEDYRKGNELIVEMNEAYGQLEVSSGEVFHVEILEETGDRNQLIQKLEQDLVFDFEVVEENEAGILYRQFLPQGGQEFWHFYISTQYENRDYVIKDVSMSELNEFQSRKIYDALTFAALHEKAQSPS